MSKLKLSSLEKEMVAIELTDRVKDLVYMTTHDKMRKIVDTMCIDTLRTEDSIELTYKFNLVVGDVLQVIGHKRRMEESNL